MPVTFTFAEPMPTRVADLSVPERWLLWATRALVQLAAQDRHHCRHVFDTLDCHGIGDCVGPISALARLFTLGATRALGFGATSCLTITPDEQRLLAAIQHVQADRGSHAVRLMAAGLAPAVARLTIGPLHDIAHALHLAGIELPERVLNPVFEPFADERAATHLLAAMPRAHSLAVH